MGGPWQNWQSRAGPGRFLQGRADQAVSVRAGQYSARQVGSGQCKVRTGQSRTRSRSTGQDRERRRRVGQCQTGLGKTWQDLAWSAEPDRRDRKGSVRECRARQDRVEPGWVDHGRIDRVGRDRAGSCKASNVWAVWGRIKQDSARQNATKQRQERLSVPQIPGALLSLALACACRGSFSPAGKPI